MLEIEAAWPINQPKAAVVALTLGIVWRCQALGRPPQ